MAEYRLLVDLGETQTAEGAKDSHPARVSPNGKDDTFRSLFFGHSCQWSVMPKLDDPMEKCNAVEPPKFGTSNYPMSRRNVEGI